MSGLALITALSITIPEDSPTPLKQTFRPINRYVNQIRVEFQRIFAAVFCSAIFLEPPIALTVTPKS